MGVIGSWRCGFVGIGGSWALLAPGRYGFVSIASSWVLCLLLAGRFIPGRFIPGRFVPGSSFLGVVLATCWAFCS